MQFDVQPSGGKIDAEAAAPTIPTAGAGRFL
jgi:hypothetical protein